MPAKVVLSMTNLVYHANSLDATAQKAWDYAQGSRAKSTRRAYDCDWKDFTRFCTSNRLESLPAAPQTLALYLADLAGHAKVATIRRRAVAISQRHKQRGLESPVAHPVVRDVLRGIVNSKGCAPVKKDALTLEAVKSMLLAVRGTDLQVARDRALLLVTFWGGFRRSEVAALDVEDIRFDKAGAVVTLRRSKTDQIGEGREVALPELAIEAVCPVRALREWLTLSQTTSGALFKPFSFDRSLSTNIRISGCAIAMIVKRLANRAGLEGDFGAHSLRSGFVTSAAQAGVSEVDIARVTGHRSVAVLRGYVRRATLFDGAAQLRMVRQGVAS
jgi:integrase